MNIWNADFSVVTAALIVNVAAIAVGVIIVVLLLLFVAAYLISDCYIPMDADLVMFRMELWTEVIRMNLLDLVVRCKTHSLTYITVSA